MSDTVTGGNATLTAPVLPASAAGLPGASLIKTLADHLPHCPIPATRQIEFEFGPDRERSHGTRKALTVPF